MNLHTRLSVQAKMLFVLVAGLLGFTAYFAVNYVILKGYSESMEMILHRQLPALEVTNDISNAMSALRSSATQALLAQNFDGIGHVDRANKQISAAFTKSAPRNPSITQL